MRHVKSFSTRSSRGFTLVEVGIVVPMLLLIAFFLFDALFNMINASTAERARFNAVYDRQTAMTIIENDSVLTSSYIPTIDTNVTDPYPTSAYSGTWSYRGDSSTSRVLLLRAYSTTTNPLASDRQPVFIGDPSTSGSPTGACNATNIYFNTVQQHDIIYYVKNNNLYRRKLIDKTTLLCVGQYQKLSCPSQADITAAGLGTRNSTCDADDELLAQNVSNFSVAYYADKGATPLDVYAVGADANLVTTAVDAEVTLTVSQKAGGQTVSSTSTLRMSKINSVAKST